MLIPFAIDLVRAEIRAHVNGPKHLAALDRIEADLREPAAKAPGAPAGKLYIRALSNPISFPGFPGVLRGAIGEVPAGFEAGAKGHVDRGAAEWVTVEAERTQPAPGPASAAVPELEAETEEQLQAELDALEQKPTAAEPDAPREPAPEAPHKGQVDCVHCGKPYPEHAKNNQKPNDKLECEGLRRGFKPPAATS